MHVVPQPLLRTDTRLDLALVLKHSPSPTTPRAIGQALLPVVGTIGQRRSLKRTESYGKGGSPGSALLPTASTQGSFLTHKLPTDPCKDAAKSPGIPVFSHIHEDDHNVGLDFGKWHFDAGEGSPVLLHPSC
jgi:hypothetical protein